MKTARYSLLSTVLLLPAVLALVMACAPPDPGAAGEWPHHGADLASSKYSARDQINAENFAQLEVAWHWESADARLQGAYDTGSYTATPLMVGGTVYAATSHGQVAALDPATGETRQLTGFIPSPDFLTHLQFFDQFAPSHLLWSADSTKLVFAGVLDSSETPGVWVVDAVGGSPPRRIADGRLAFWVPPTVE